MNINLAGRCAVVTGAGAGMELGAALTHDDVTGDDDLTPEFLDAETPSGAVAPVAGGPAGLLVCHETLLLRLGPRRRPRRPTGW